MKKITALLLVLCMLLPAAACGPEEPEQIDVPQISQIRSICNLAVMECYYHNVAKYHRDGEEGFLFDKKDTDFWMEYGGIVTLGINAALVTTELDGNVITVTIPEAEILACNPDAKSLENSFYSASGSAIGKAEEGTMAMSEAQKKLRESVAQDKSLLRSAQNRAEELISDYIENIGLATGTEYQIRFVYLSADGRPIQGPDGTAEAPALPVEEAPAE